MPNVNKQVGQRYKAWLKQSYFDLQAAYLSLENSFNEWAAYQAEQSVEKALKAVIVHAGERAPKVHKLSVLFGFANSVNIQFRQTEFSFRNIESFTFITRYPFLLPDKNRSPHELITHKDALEVVSQAEDIYQKIKQILEKGKPDYEHIAKFDKEIMSGIKKEDLEKRLVQIKDLLVREFKPEKIILFGSYAREPLPQKLTTMDILMITPTNLSFIERIQKARDITRGGLPTIEPLVYTPEEFKTMTEEEGESFFESALEEGRVIYAK